MLRIIEWILFTNSFKFVMAKLTFSYIFFILGHLPIACNNSYTECYFNGQLKLWHVLLFQIDANLFQIVQFLY